MPAARYRIWLAEPSRDPSASAPSNTTIGCSVSGTAVNGTGTLICAATIVRTVTKSTEAILIPRAVSTDAPRAARALTSVVDEDAAMAANCTPPLQRSG